MSQGSEPAGNDGLPPAGPQVPADARDLDRDVLAYRREQRALRWRLRGQRWLGVPPHRSSGIRPLVAGFALLALLSAVLLVVFAAR
jgi:hypothetical protein